MGLEFRRLVYGMRDGMKKYFYETSTFVYALPWVALCVFAFLVFPPVEVRAAGFVLKKTELGYEPEAYEAVALPGTNFKAGSFRFVIDEDNETAKAGVLVSNEILYYVEHERYARVPFTGKWFDYGEVFDAGGDCNYGVYNDYFTLDCWAYGSVSGHNRRMFLFRVSKDTVELLDIIGRAYVEVSGKKYGLDFVSMYNGERTKPVWVDVRDFDNDGNPEVELQIERGHRTDFIFQLQVFSLYFEIADDKLKLDPNPVLYKPLFDQARLDDPSKRVSYVYSIQGEGFPDLVPTSPKRKSDAYYIYGFLSGELKLDEIKSSLEPDGELYEGQYKSVVPLLENRDKWDDGFHFAPAERPVLLNYELNRR